MKDLQLRLEVEAAAQEWVAAVMQQNNIPASIMEEALIGVQLMLKDIMLREALRSLPIEEEKESMEREEEDAGSNTSADNES